MRFNRGFLKSSLGALVAALALPFKGRVQALPIPQPVPKGAGPLPQFRAVDRANEAILAERLCRRLREFYRCKPRPWRWKGSLPSNNNRWKGAR